ncbi:MAG: hypothetical protein GY869_29485, partial [Planctomycetes bacterium]|nr:hypothetical protein [Planctomycetota bacterium]
DPNPPRIGALIYQSDGKPIDLRFCPAAEIPLGQWSHFAFTGDGSTATLWVNGYNVCSTPYDGTIKINMGNQDGLRISSIFPEFSYQGLIDDIKLHLKPRDAVYMGTRVQKIPIELASPADGYQNAAPNQTLQWYPGKGPFNYQYELSLKQLPAGDWIHLTTTTNHQYQCSGLLPNTQYQWRITPIRNGVPTPSQSEIWTFKTLTSDNYD